ncbi:MAG: hypothetical protein HS129_00110 [Leptospiraceae bacterium]|nr:hypothetical protein [Leptospiraceae bacterium]
MRLLLNMKYAILIFLLFGFCSDDTEKISREKTINEIIVATLYKIGECKQFPGYFLVPPKEPYKYGVDACVFSIIRTPCPFNQYPLICIEMYKVDVKGIGPKINNSIEKIF